LSQKNLSKTEVSNSNVLPSRANFEKAWPCALLKAQNIYLREAFSKKMLKTENRSFFDIFSF